MYPVKQSISLDLFNRFIPKWIAFDEKPFIKLNRYSFFFATAAERCSFHVPFPIHTRRWINYGKKQDCTHQPLTVFNPSTCQYFAKSCSPINIYRCALPTQYLLYNETRPRIVKVLQALTPDNRLTGFSIYAVKALSLTPVFVLSSHVKSRTCIIRISLLKIETNGQTTPSTLFFRGVKKNENKKRRKFNINKIENVPRVFNFKIFSSDKKDRECSDRN